MSALIMAACCSNLKLKQLDFSLHFALKNRDTLIEQSVIPMEQSKAVTQKGCELE